MTIRQIIQAGWARFSDFCASLEEDCRQRMETPTPCQSCQKTYLYKDLQPTFAAWWAEPRTASLQELGLVMGRLHPHSYCPTCWKPLQEEQAKARARIREELAKQQRLAERFPKEARLVHTHNTRASSAGGKATLTVEQWLNTLEYYKYLCAYCSGPYEELEHRIPIDRGGGTVAHNCVPSCRSCNRRKGTLHPDDIMAKDSSLSPGAHRRIAGEMEQLHGPRVLLPEVARTEVSSSSEVAFIDDL